MKVSIHTNNGVITFKDKVLPALGTTLVSYLKSGGSISNYVYTLCIFSGNTYLASYTGALSYCAVGSNLKLIFTFVVPQVPSGANALKLVLSNTFFAGAIACAINVKLSGFASALVCWILCFQFSQNDRLTPLLTFAVFGVPSQVSSRLSIGYNITKALGAIQSYGFIKSPVTINLYICGNQYTPYINITPSGQSYSISYIYIPSPNQTEIKSICLTICLCKGTVTFFKTNYPVSVIQGQTLVIQYSVVIE